MKAAIIFDWVGTLADLKGKKFSYSESILKKFSKEYKLGLVTRSLSGGKKREKQLERSNLLKYFGSVIINPKAKLKKDFQKCIGELEISEKNTLVVGDMASKEIRAGNAIGCKTVWLSEGDKSWDKPKKKSDEPDFIIPTVKQLPEVITEI